MRARKVSIMLVLVALSALTLFVISVFDSPAEAAVTDSGVLVPALPDTLLSYEEILFVGSDGSGKVEITAVLGQGGQGDLLLPFDFLDGTDFSVLSGPAAFVPGDGSRSAPTTTVLGYRMLHLETETAAASGDTIRITASVPDWYSADDADRPYGEYFLQRNFANTSRFVMRSLRVGVVLPPGMLVHSVEKVVPAYDPKKNPSPPFDIYSVADRTAAALTVKDLAPAKAVRLDLNIRPKRRGLIPLVAGLVLAVLYLVFFRDVLGKRKAK